MTDYERDECPECKMSLVGPLIWEHFYRQFTTTGDWRTKDGNFSPNLRVLSKTEAKKRADETASLYGATRTKGNFRKDIGIIENDRCVKFRCPKCGAEWPR